MLEETTTQRTAFTIPHRSVFVRVADEINVALESHFWLFGSLFTLLLLGGTIVKDLGTNMWLDELYTLHMAQQASPGEIIRATLEGCDGAPPLYAMIVHAILPWVRHEALAVRLPAVFGYCGMFLCVLAFSRRRLPAVYSWAAALLAALACEPYSTEGRCYGVILGCAAGALLCWQSAVDGRRRILAIPLLAFCLALMTAMHYYTVFFSVPLFFGEMARWRKSGKMDFAILAAMIPVPFVLALHYPFIVAGRRFQEHFWSPAVWSRIPYWYSRYFALEICLLPLCSLAVFWRMKGARSAGQAGLTRPEWIAAGAFLLMPFCLIVLSIFTTHVFVDRYVLWTVPGIAVLVSALLCVAARGKIVVGVSLLGLLLASLALREAHSTHVRLVLSPDTERVRRELALLPRGSETIVVPDHYVFMEMSYYEPPPLRERLIHPVSPDLDLRYFGSDTDALLISALGHRTKLHIGDYDTVLAAHPRFILAATARDYLPRRLVAAGYHVVPIGSSPAPVLYEVTAPETK